MAVAELDDMNTGGFPRARRAPAVIMRLLSWGQACACTSLYNPGRISFYTKALILSYVRRREDDFWGPFCSVIQGCFFAVFRGCGGHEFRADEVEGNTWNLTAIFLTQSRQAVLTVLQAGQAGGTTFPWDTSRRPRLASLPAVWYLHDLNSGAAGLPFVRAFEISHLSTVYYVSDPTM